MTIFICKDCGKSINGNVTKAIRNGWTRAYGTFKGVAFKITLCRDHNIPKRIVQAIERGEVE